MACTSRTRDGGKHDYGAAATREYAANNANAVCSQDFADRHLQRYNDPEEILHNSTINAEIKKVKGAKAEKIVNDGLPAILNVMSRWFYDKLRSTQSSFTLLHIFAD
jgi:hypothetical protein